MAPCDFCKDIPARSYDKDGVVRMLCHAHASSWIDGDFDPWGDDSRTKTPSGIYDTPPTCSGKDCGQPASIWVASDLGYCVGCLPSGEWGKADGKRKPKPEPVEDD